MQKDQREKRLEKHYKLEHDYGFSGVKVGRASVTEKMKLTKTRCTVDREATVFVFSFFFFLSGLILRRERRRI